MVDGGGWAGGGSRSIWYKLHKTRLGADTTRRTQAGCDPDGRRGNSLLRGREARAGTSIREQTMCKMGGGDKVDGRREVTQELGAGCSAPLAAAK